MPTDDQDDDWPDDGLAPADDDPPTCYFTGRGPCGDCRDPATNRPLNCFTTRE